jgi:hypothetical protein
MCVYQIRQPGFVQAEMLGQTKQFFGEVAIYRLDESPRRQPMRTLSLEARPHRPSLSELDRKSFYPMIAPRVYVRPETSRLAMASVNHWNDCEHIAVVGSVERAPIRMPNEDEMTSTQYNRCRGGSYRNAGRKSRRHIKYHRHIAVVAMD